MTSSQRLAAPTDAPEPTHACVRCGRAGVPMDRGLCEQCNPLDLAQPSATQVHGIAALGIVAFVLLLAVIGRFAIAGTGPFDGSVETVGAADGGLAVTLVVRNEGEKAAATTCRITAAGNVALGVRQVVQTPVVQPGSELRFTTTVTKFGTTVTPLAADCQSP